MGGGGNSGMKKAQRCFSCHSLNHYNNCSSSTCSYQSAVEEEGQELQLQPTALFLSSSPTGVADLTQPSKEQRLYLPRVGTAPCSLDVYLQSIPSVASRCTELQQLGDVPSNNKNQNQASNLTTKSMSSQRCLNVLQGEVAHATPDQTDVLVSAEATTCHIVALRSTTDGNDSVPLGSMAHVDQAQVYNDCLDKMVQEHIQHHVRNLQQHDNPTADDMDDFGFFMDDDSDEEDDDDEDYPNHDASSSRGSFLPHPTMSSGSTSAMKRPRRSKSLPGPIRMELHIAGGYLDEEGTSQQLSDNLIRTFSDLALKYQDQIHMSLSTAMISSMNNTTKCTDNKRRSSSSDKSNAPRSRGLALDTRTGQVTPVTTSLPHELEGPALEVRSARLWSSSRQRTPSLAVIHTPESQNGTITIEPFDYQPQPQLNALLRVDDKTLLKVASTSPNCESDRFCSDLRRTLSFVNSVPASHVFGSTQNEHALVYSRSSNALNQWEPVPVPQRQQRQRRASTTTLASSSSAAR